MKNFETYILYRKAFYYDVMIQQGHKPWYLGYGMTVFLDLKELNPVRSMGI